MNTGGAGPAGGGDTGGGGTGGEAVGCTSTVDHAAYDPSRPGCGSYANCQGQIHFTNTTAQDWMHPIISFEISDGVRCTDTHSASKWDTSDDGGASHRCVFIAKNPDDRGSFWSIRSETGWAFGYDTTQADPTAPANIVITDESCAVP